MNPAHQAPIHSGSPGPILKGLYIVKTSAGYCSKNAPKANPITGPIAEAAYSEAIIFRVKSKEEELFLIKM